MNKQELPTIAPIRLQTKMFGEIKAPFMIFGNKKYFLMEIEGQDHVVIQQGGGNMPYETVTLDKWQKKWQ